LKALPAKLGLPPEHLFFCGTKYTVETTQDGEGQDHVLILASLKGVANQVRHTPKKTDDLAVVHTLTRRMELAEEYSLFTKNSSLEVRLRNGKKEATTLQDFVTLKN
jgi:hypothetical protein